MEPDVPRFCGDVMPSRRRSRVVEPTTWSDIGQGALNFLWPGRQSQGYGPMPPGYEQGALRQSSRQRRAGAYGTMGSAPTAPPSLDTSQLARQAAEIRRLRAAKALGLMDEPEPADAPNMQLGMPPAVPPTPGQLEAPQLPAAVPPNLNLPGGAPARPMPGGPFPPPISKGRPKKKRQKPTGTPTFRLTGLPNMFGD